MKNRTFGLVLALFATDTVEYHPEYADCRKCRKLNKPADDMLQTTARGRRAGTETIPSLPAAI